MSEGRAIEAAAPRDIYARPNSAFAARFFGTTNLVAGTVGRDRVGRRAVIGAGLVMRAPIETDLADGAAVTACFKAESVVVHRTPPAAADNLYVVATVKSVLFLGKVSQVQLAAGALDMVGFVSQRDEVAVGEIVHLEVKPAEIVVIA